MKLQFTSGEIVTLALQRLKSLGFEASEDFVVTEEGKKVEIGGRRFAENYASQKYICAFDWPIGCSVQCGADGIVLKPGAPTMEAAITDVQAGLDILTRKAPHRKTAFFEAFPRKPDTFIRGEGKTVEEAEKSCWEKYQKQLNCPGHEFERRDRIDG